MNLKDKMAVATVGALSMCGLANSAFAASELLPGITTGIPLGAPLPEGVFDIVFPNYGSRNSTPQVDIGSIAPSWVIWSTPWTFAGGHILFDAVTPAADINIENVLHKQGLLNPAIDVQLKWDLGGGFFGGVQAGIYFPIENNLSAIGVARNFASFQGIGAVSYLKDGWNLSATLIYGTGRNGSVLDPGSYGAEWLNIDLTATKKFGKFEIGPVAFGSTDLSAAYSGYLRQSQFAVGGLVGYDFGAVNAQVKLTRNVAETNYGGYETRVWGNLIIPIWVASHPAQSAVAAKY